MGNEARQWQAKYNDSRKQAKNRLWLIFLLIGSIGGYVFFKIRKR